MPLVVVLSTTPDKKSARKIARILIQKKLAACVSFREGWESVYSWKGKTETSSEVLLLIKTTTAKFKALQQAILKIHPYEVPEILALPVTGVSAAYSRWLEKATI